MNNGLRTTPRSNPQTMHLHKHPEVGRKHVSSGNSQRLGGIRALLVNAVC